MILENDPWIADLLKQIVLSIRPALQVDWFTQVQKAIEAWQLSPYQLVLTEWILSDATGINLLKNIRNDDRSTPVVIITGHSDRASVMSVRALGVSAFITKPFQVPRVMECLTRLIPLPDTAISNPPLAEDFIVYLAGRDAGELDLPLIGNVRAQMLSCLKGEKQDLRELAASWQQDPALCAKLIAVANSSAYNNGGKSCLSHIEALRKLGVQTCLNLAMGMALRQFTEQATPLLQLNIQRQLDEIERLAQRTTALSRQCRMDPAPLHTAAMLHRMGELCVLHLAQIWENSGHILDDDQVMQAIARFSRPFAISLKAHWGLPMPLRELIGAVYALPPVQVRREQVVMRLAAAELQGEDLSSIERLQRLAGLA
jgi:HD-like signal output (HDOD) protein/ActR/RegA family two-component response regulator